MIKVKAKYYHDTNTAGPQSRLLDGLTWDEARRVRDEGLVKVLGPRAAALVAGGVTSEMPVAAASKAIIQRDIRNAAVIYDVSNLCVYFFYILSILTGVEC